MKLNNTKIALVALLFMMGFLVSDSIFNQQTTSITGMTTASGTLKICVNAPPVLAMSCGAKAYTGTYYTCDIDASDLDDSHSGVTQTLTFTDDTNLFDINPSTGVISFTPTTDQIGNHSIIIMVQDNSTCSNSVDSETLNITITQSRCGDGVCNGAEKCSTCSQDCGGCGEEEAVEGGAGGGGGGGASSQGFHVDYSRMDSKILRTSEKQTLSISYDGITRAHQLRITEVNEDSITCILKSEAVTFTIKLGQTKEFDTNNDGSTDFTITLQDIQEKDVWLYFEKEEGFEVIFREKMVDFLKLKPSIIRISLKVGDSIEKSVIVENIGPIPLDVDIEVENIDDLVKLRESSFSIESLQTTTIDIEYNAKEDIEPGVYSGRLLFYGENFEKSIPIIFEIETRRLIFDVKINIPGDYKEVLPGSEIEADIDLFNLEDTPEVNVILTYQIRDPKGNIVASEEESVKTGSDVSFSKKLSVPTDAEPGKYVFVTTAKYADSFATATDVFNVVTEEMLAPPRDYTTLFLAILVILILSGLSFSIFVYEQHKKGLPRFHFKELAKKNYLMKKKKKLMKSIKKEIKRLKRGKIDVSDEESLLKRL